VDDFFRGRHPYDRGRELLRFAREVAWPPRLAKIAATDREGSIAGRIAVRSSMHTDLNVSVFEFNRRSIRPHFEFAQLFV